MAMSIYLLFDRLSTILHFLQNGFIFYLREFNVVEPIKQQELGVNI